MIGIIPLTTFEVKLEVKYVKLQGLFFMFVASHKRVKRPGSEGNNAIRCPKNQRAGTLQKTIAKPCRAVEVAHFAVAKRRKNTSTWLSAARVANATEIIAKAIKTRRKRLPVNRLSSLRALVNPSL